MKMTKEVQETSQKEVATPSRESGLVGFTSEDVEIPTLLLMQNTSELVGEEKAKLGDIFHTGQLQVVGGLDTPVEVLALGGSKTHVIYDLSGKTPKFLRQEKVTAENENAPSEDTENGKPIRRDLSLNYLVVLVDAIKEGMPFPTLISFRRTNSRAGRQLASHFMTSEFMDSPAFSQVVTIGSRKEKYESNTYAVFEFGKGRKATNEEMAICDRLMPRVKKLTASGQIKVKGETLEAKKPTVVGVPDETW